MISIKLGLGFIFLFLFVHAVSAIECNQTPDSTEIWKNDSIACDYSNDILTCHQTMEKEICIEEAVQPCDFKFDYSVTYENMSVEECYVIHDGKKLQCNPPLVTDETSYEWSGTKTIGVTLPSCLNGDVYKIVLKTEDVSPIKGNFDYIYDFGGSGYVENGMFKISAPKDIPLFFYSTKSTEPTVEENGNTVSYTWSKKDIPALKQEDYTPPMGKLIDIIFVSSFKDYSEIANWTRNLFEPNVQPASVKWKADEITNKTGEDAAKQIYDWIRNNIHYVPLEFGELTGFQPHSASEILSRGNGDCKDFSTILTSLLKAKGLDAEPVLYSPDSVAFPTMSMFNHVVTRLNIDNKTVWLDPTCEYCPYGSFPYTEYDSYVLPFMSSTNIEKTPPHKTVEGDSYIETTYHVMNGSITAVAMVSGSNDLIDAEYSKKMFKSMTDEQINKTFDTVASSICSDYYGLNFSLENMNDSYAPFISEMSMNCRDLAKVNNNRMSLNVFGNIQTPNYLSPTEREYDLFFGANSRYEEKIEVYFPANYEVTSDFKNFHVSATNYSYSFEYSKEKNKAVVTTETISPVEMPKVDYDNLKDVYRKLSAEAQPVEATIGGGGINFIYIIVAVALLVFIALFFIIKFSKNKRRTHRRHAKRL
jgi:hypothetical protein